jgi:hypothetical protein
MLFVVVIIIKFAIVVFVVLFAFSKAGGKAVAA